MKTRFSFLAAFWSVFLMEACAPESSLDQKAAPLTAAQIHRGAIVLDAHVDTLQRVLMSGAC